MDKNEMARQLLQLHGTIRLDQDTLREVADNMDKNEAARQLLQLQETVLDNDTVREVTQIVVDINQPVRIGVVIESVPVVEVLVTLFDHYLGIGSTNEV